ncbi:MAG: P1 family peptidase [Christensenellales bacterium]|jgi:L-aminopeptidase/D-esterase-like protein|nr:P1 family peptidase [Clostridiales bacterium]
MLKAFKIGHYTDLENGTGCTVVLCEEGATAGVSVMGSAPATRETDLLQTEKTVDKINAVILSGGSAFGLEASCGVMQYLREKGIGYNAGGYRVPIVCGASLYDLEYKNFAYPDKEAGYKACLDAKVKNFQKGEIGAAAGATISKVLGMETAKKTSLGIQTYRFNQLEIAVIVAVNALGDIVKDGKIIAGMQDPEGNFISAKKIMTAGGIEPTNSNTTIGVILTNATLSKKEANILAALSHDGFAKALSPSHTAFDGDAMFVMASNEVKVDINILSSIIPDLTEQAIHSSVMNVDPINARVSKAMFAVLQKMFKKK